MGTVLAMSRLRGLASLLLGLTALTALTACGTERTSFIDQAFAVVGQLTARGQTGPTLRERLTPEALAQIGTPILIVEFPQTGSEAGAQPLRTEGDLEIWSTLNGVQFAFRDGILIYTRGIPGDLMSADVRNVQRALVSGGAEVVRVHRYLDGENQEVVRAYVCDYQSAGRVQVTVLTGSYRARRVTETCVSSSDAFENHYWIDAQGVMRKSTQWIGPKAGYVNLERIND
jgi:hypothetical protein